ncbi:MAG: putative addiction module antidote protein [Alphaproteobacteria bacterium]|nr:putative addiction module antidote protein [Alphaproteobacteria bacterium]MBV9373260.1 putative addiction module antidote protein [Alphaproteobacteria bacterium]MBV9901226.1 putative addiction module antidote protein [Alphaproteobacteria bacterium]
MALAIKRFDASKHFESPEAQARLVDDALRSGNAGYIANAIGVVARARGMSALAKATGLSRQALYSALSEDGNPSLDTIVKVTHALGIELHAGAAANEAEPQAELKAYA